jgi:hypothetical protein
VALIDRRFVAEVPANPRRNIAAQQPSTSPTSTGDRFGQAKNMPMTSPWMRSCVRRISGSSARPSSAHDGIEYFAGAHQSFWFGDSQTQVDLPSGQS